ncbi:MAG: hypothetical protein VX278_22345 [Myxococcota bacterium]|nr:hypothetical protein [Myxococcota bacterium]
MIIFLHRRGILSKKATGQDEEEVFDRFALRDESAETLLHWLNDFES